MVKKYKLFLIFEFLLIERNYGEKYFIYAINFLIVIRLMIIAGYKYIIQNFLKSNKEIC